MGTKVGERLIETIVVVQRTSQSASMKYHEPNPFCKTTLSVIKQLFQICYKASIANIVK